jgi:hypothetical protein
VSRSSHRFWHEAAGTPCLAHPHATALACLAVVGLVAGCTGNDLPGAEATPAEKTGAWFTEITEPAGIDFVYDAGGTGMLYIAEVMGAGAALFDYDLDGDLDIYLTNGNHGLPQPGTDGTVRNRLYRQEGGGRFSDVTLESGLGDAGYGMGVAIGDVDNDGDPDVYVTNLGPDRLYRNNGDGTFEDVSAAAGVDLPGWSSSAAFCDLDRDGFLDLYVARYVRFLPERRCYDDAGRDVICGPTAFPPEPDLLLHNNGDGTFTEAAARAGIAEVAAAGLGVLCADWNGDGLPDVYVANDAYANHMWINRGDGTFRDDALLMGVALNLHGQAEAGMGVTAADFDSDGTEDIFITHLRRETNTLYRSLGEGIGFVDATGESGLGDTSMPFTGFGTAALDVELDGDLDLLIVNGRVHQHDPLPGATLPPPLDGLAEPNLFYLNDGTGRFTPAGPEADTLCAPIEISRGLAVGDLDGDGDADLLVANIEGPARLYRNDAPERGHWLAVRAFDPALGRDAIGARVTVRADGRRQVRTINRGNSYLSSSEPVARFGLGQAVRVERVDVLWPDGLRESFPAVEADREIRLERGTGEASHE